MFSGVFGYQFGLDGLSTNGKPERIVTNYVSGNFFSALELQPAFGRLLLPSQGEVPGADPVMVLGYAYWSRTSAAIQRWLGRRFLSTDGQ